MAVHIMTAAVQFFNLKLPVIYIYIKALILLITSYSVFNMFTNNRRIKRAHFVCIKLKYVPTYPIFVPISIYLITYVFKYIAICLPHTLPSFANNPSGDRIKYLGTFRPNRILSVYTIHVLRTIIPIFINFNRNLGQ